MPRIHRTLVLLVLLAVVSASTGRAGAEAPPVKIYVFSGQSNMGVSAGRNYVRANHPEIGKWVESEDNDVLLFHRRVTDTQQGKPGEKLGQRRVWGYEVMVGYHLWHYWQRKDPAQEFVIVKVAKGATGISFWSPDRSAKGYKALAAPVGDAIKHVTDQGKRCEGGAFFWYQGEHDTTPVISSHGAREYPAQLDSLVEATRATSASGEPGIRALLQSPRMPFVLARVHYYPNRAGFNIEHYRREVGKWVQADDHQPAAMINTDDLTMRDGLHKVVLEHLKPEGVKTGRLRPIVKGRTWEGGWFRELLPRPGDRSDP
jgi:hypothetical protein